MDEDSDGDGVGDSVEAGDIARADTWKNRVMGVNYGGEHPLPDTDNDGVPDWLDPDIVWGSSMPYKTFIPLVIR